MKKTYTSIIFIFIALIAIAQPANDECNNAVLLTNNNQVVGSTSNANTGSNACTGTLQDVWYKFTATATTHAVTITSTNSALFYAYILSGNCNTQTCFWNNQENPGNSNLEIPLNNLIIGNVYYIAIAQGDFNLPVDFTIKLVNPTSTPLCDITTETIHCEQTKNVNLTGDGLSATIQCTDGNNISSGTGKEIMYRFTPSKSGNYAILPTATNGNFINYFIKPVSQGCDNQNWTCLGALGNQSQINEGLVIPIYNLNACTEYYLLFDADLNTATTQTFKLIVFPNNGTHCTLFPCPNLTTPLQSATNVATNTSIAWASVVGAAGYKIKISTINTVLVNTVDIGLVTSYQPSILLPANTTIYIKITPYTCKGEESNCADLSFTTKALPAPNNDLCANATQLTPQPSGTTTCVGGATNQTTVGATANAPAAYNFCMANEDEVWYKFTTTIAGTYTINFCNIALVTGQSNGAIGWTSLDNCTTPHISASCGAGTITNGSATRFMSNLLANTTYYLMVWCPGVENAYNFDISVITPEAIPPPVNDECSGAIAFSNFVGNDRNSIAPNTANATASGLSACTVADDDVWYKFTVPQGISTLKYEINTGSFSSEFKIYSGTCNNLTEIGTCYDAVLGLIAGLTGGNTFYLRTYTKLGNVASNFAIHLSVPLIGDYCENAIQIPSLLDYDEHCLNINTFDSRPTSLPVCYNEAIDNDIFLSFTIPAGYSSIEFSSERLAGSPNVIMQLFSGSCGSLSLVKCFTLGATAGFTTISGLTAGQTYYLRIYNQILNTGALYKLCFKKPDFHFTGIGSSDWTDASSWKPFYPGTTIPNHSTAYIDNLCIIPVNTIITNNGTLYANVAPNRLVFNSTFINNGYFSKTTTFFDDLEAPLIENYGYFQIIFSSNASFSDILNFKGNIINKVDGTFENFNAIRFANGNKFTNEGIFKNEGLLYGTITSSGTFENNFKMDLNLINSGSFVCGFASQIIGSTIINSSTNIPINGKIAPGNSAGIITANPSISAASTAIFDMEILGNQADKVISTGNIAINGNLRLSLNNAQTGSYTIIDGTSLSGNFIGIEYSVNGGAYTSTKPDNLSIIYDNVQGTVTVVIIAAALPVELTHFKAQNTEGGNLLTWQTATEINSSHYDIERSTEGKVFHKIGETKAQGKAATYEYLDKYPLSTTTYYRLKINDLDGKSSYSNVVSIANKKKGLRAKVYPNPFGDNLTIDILMEKNSDLTVEVIDILGRQVFQSKVENTEGSFQLPISLKQIPSGNYFIKITDGQTIFQEKIVKQ